MKDTSLLIYLVIIILILLVGVMIYAIATYQTHSRHTKDRIKQLLSQDKKFEKEVSDTSKDDDIRKLIDKVTAPVADGMLKYHRMQRADRDRRELKEAGLDKYFNPISWLAFRIILGILGVALGFLFATKNVYIGVIVALILLICPTWLIKDSYNRRQQKLLSKFPETIRIISGYLSASKALPDAFKLAADTAAEMWKPYLLTFSDKCNSDGSVAALEWLKKEIDIEEATQFFSTIRLSLESGKSSSQSFAAQARTIDKLLDAENMKEINRRKTMGTVVKGPLMLLIILVIALPIAGMFLDIF